MASPAFIYAFDLLGPERFAANEIGRPTGRKTCSVRED